jgi:hypothetical protein
MMRKCEETIDALCDLTDHGAPLSVSAQEHVLACPVCAAFHQSYQATLPARTAALRLRLGPVDQALIEGRLRRALDRTG